MKKNIYMSLVTALLCVIYTCLTACGSDDDAQPSKPVVSLTEVGHGNSRHVHPAHDLHLEAAIVAEGLIKSITIKIHQKSEGTFQIVESYTTGKYIGVRNTDFHEHIDIPAETPLGEYRLFFTVTDQQGQQTTIEDNLMIIEDDGEEEDEEEHQHE